MKAIKFFGFLFALCLLTSCDKSKDAVSCVNAFLDAINKKDIKTACSIYPDYKLFPDNIPPSLDGYTVSTSDVGDCYQVSYKKPDNSDEITFGVSFDGEKPVIIYSSNYYHSKIESLISPESRFYFGCDDRHCRFVQTDKDWITDKSYCKYVLLLKDYLHFKDLYQSYTKNGNKEALDKICKMYPNFIRFWDSLNKLDDKDWLITDYKFWHESDAALHGGDTYGNAHEFMTPKLSVVICDTGIEIYSTTGLYNYKEAQKRFNKPAKELTSGTDFEKWQETMLE